MNTIKIETTKNKENGWERFNFKSFQFGETPTDHFFLAEFKNGKWVNPRIEPFHSLTISPFALCFHYGQTVFEGMKAFRQDDGKVHIFRPKKHHKRFNRSLERMCMPGIEEELFLNALEKLVQLEQHWIPKEEGVSLYIRPFVIATEPRLGVKIADEYTFLITCTPIGLYYPKPVRVKVETDYVRSAEGGAGYAKCGGNYGAAFFATKKANEQGFDQVIWTDAKTHEFIEESGTMNLMLFMDNKLVTPKLSSSILDGVTRSSILQIAKDLGIPVEERPVSWKELKEHLESGNRVELFGVGTAAVISPISCVQIQEVDYFPYTKNNAVMYRLKKEIDNIRRGTTTDTYHWNHFI
ncbi:branched-chain amino acid aminotransferase [Arenibacter sp. M-2]|uniref:branched-chain amino acid aminotransferase n=1 Tax=Arenibacter sp. M-2 TaxID=3053612 RepID=UPI00256FF700|nr:branched-chain amino acid aminotransferase [Arenibacter sp. M-2]MDL5511226.1 branched-chain amino acid aminotransferase [Arenibacter sp. M-2]